jgi:peptidoglycan/LPS O-acetylase OafA/YrhL
MGTREPTVSVEPTVKNVDRILGFDGVRALAVLLVFASHVWIGVPELMKYGWYKVFPRGGFLGVNVFFVLSGFLITYRLSTIRAGSRRAGLRSYFAGRFMRIMPLALLFLASHVVYVALIGYPPDYGLSEETTGVVSTIFQYSNYAILRNTSVLKDNVAIWSLSIEGQFYILAPLLVIPLAIAARKTRWAGLVLLAMLVPLILNAGRVFDNKGWFDVYIRTDTRISSLVIGVLGAFIWLNFRKAFPRVLGILSLLAPVAAGIIVAKGRADGSFIWKGGMALFDFACLVVILSLAFACCPLVRILELRPLKWLGEISYGLYLWQLPVLWMVNRHGLSLDWRLRLILIPVVVAMSAATCTCFERPLMRGAIAQRLRGAGGNPRSA